MATPVLSETVTGKCEHCGDEGVQVFRDNSRCEECDGQFYPCSVCKTEENRDDHCRHIFEDREGEWLGAGVGIPETYQLEVLKKSLFKLLSLMPEHFATDLRTAIKSGQFYTWSVMPMIGGGGSLKLNGMPDRDGKYMHFAWGEALMEIGAGDHAEETRDGYRWLVSLYQRSTLKANRATTAWIDEWLKQEQRS